MMETIKPSKMTQKEKDLTFALGGFLEDWVSKNKTERSELMCAVSMVCAVLFIEETPFKGNLDKQFREIDAFCNYLKFLAGKENGKH